MDLPTPPSFYDAEDPLLDARVPDLWSFGRINKTPARTFPVTFSRPHSGISKGHWEGPGDLVVFSDPTPAALPLFSPTATGQTATRPGAHLRRLASSLLVAELGERLRGERGERRGRWSVAQSFSESFRGPFPPQRADRLCRVGVCYGVDLSQLVFVSCRAACFLC